MRDAIEGSVAGIAEAGFSVAGGSRRLPALLLESLWKMRAATESTRRSRHRSSLLTRVAPLHQATQCSAKVSGRASAIETTGIGMPCLPDGVVELP